MNLFLTEDGVLKMGYYGLTTLSECYGIKIMNHDGFRRFAPEVSRRQYEVMSDLWYLGVALVEMMGVSPCVESKLSGISYIPGCIELPYDKDAIESSDLVDFLHNCFVVGFIKEKSVSEFMNVSGMGWRMMNSIHL